MQIFVLKNDMKHKSIQDRLLTTPFTLTDIKANHSLGTWRLILKTIEVNSSDTQVNSLEYNYQNVLETQRQVISKAEEYEWVQSA